MGYRVAVAALHLPEGQHAELYVLREGESQVHLTPVRFAHLEADAAIVTTDLSDYAAYVTRGQHQLRDGDKVRILPTESE
ncbi:hypothetical protein MAIT1_05257 [Magnetofaba australis IT-1]|uniref:Uncharacterized protein n=1 Tax=Magnetofaba australis IT-1 TaxID=1434232 RepID=A0A1Y2K6J9_9PROT|nr:hypothetical protein MAIT1_05257 [Magnetofaba australis IT-1]